jgi:hypothetical protein
MARRAAATESLPHKVENSDAVTNWRQQTCAIRCKEKVASAVDGTQQVGELWDLVDGIALTVLDLPESQSSCSEYLG